MNKWDELRKECYGKDTLERYQNGRIDFSPDSMRDVENGDFKSYDEYLEVQKRSCDKVRQFFELCYYHVSGSSADFKGQILRFDQQKNKVLFKRIMVNDMYFVCISCMVTVSVLSARKIMSGWTEPVLNYLIPATASGSKRIFTVTCVRVTVN